MGGSPNSLRGESWLTVNQLMQVFTADKSADSLSADFIDPFVTWEHLPPLEPIIMGSIAWIADLDNHTAPGTLCDEQGPRPSEEVSALIDRARSLIVGLLQAAESVSVSSESMYFNGFIAVRTRASAAMARSLYRTVALHLMDMAVTLLRVSPIDREGQGLEKALVAFVNWEALCGDLHAAVFGNTDDVVETSMAVRALTMAWPMMAITRSEIAPFDAKLVAQECLGHGAKFMHIERQ